MSRRTDGMRLRVDIVVHGRGRGHASRTRPVVASLRRAGHHVRVFGGGAAAGVLGDDPCFELLETVGPGPALPARFARRFRADLARLRSAPPDVLVTDGDAPSMHAAARLGIPVVAVGHGMVFAHAHLATPLPMRARLREALNALSSSWLADARVAVHFADATPRDARTRLSRIDVRPEVDRTRSVGEHVVAYARDGGLRPWLEALVASGLRIELFGEEQDLPSGVTRRAPDERAFARSLSTAAGVVGTSGSNLVAECLYLGIPMLALHARDDAEQELNARILESLGGGRRGLLGHVEAVVSHRFVDAVEATRTGGRRAAVTPPWESVSDAVDRILCEVAARGAHRRTSRRVVP